MWTKEKKKKKATNQEFVALFVKWLVQKSKVDVCLTQMRRTSLAFSSLTDESEKIICLLPASICNLNKLHWHRKVIACYCNFFTSAQHSSISTRQRPRVYESPRLKISNFQSHCVSMREDTTVHLGWVMRQADNAVLWMRENQLTPTHTHTRGDAHTHSV